jgi:hypothetical protein
VKTYVEKAIGLTEDKLTELLKHVAQVKVGRNQYDQWTHCIGSFMTKLGA